MYKCNNESYSIYLDSDGPRFGQGPDLFISSGCLNNQRSNSKKSTYNMKTNTLNKKNNSFKVLDYEVFSAYVQKYN